MAPGVGFAGFADHYIPSVQPGQHGPERSQYGGGIETMNPVGPNFARLRRPFLDSWGRARVTINTGEWSVERGEKKPVIRSLLVHDLLNRGYPLPPVVNATSLRKEQWIELDKAVQMAQRLPLTFWEDMKSISTVAGFNAMGRLTYEYEAMNDPGEAVVDMEGLADGRHDEPLFKLRSLPLPITHSDFWFSQRRIAVSGNGGTPINVTMAEAAGRRVGEMIEKTAVGVETGITFGTQTTGYGTHDGTSTIYGLTNFTHRVTKTDLTTPTGANPEAVMTDVLEMVETMRANGWTGPFNLYHSTGYSRYLDDDYFRAGSTSAVRSLRERIQEIDGIQEIKRLDWLTSGYRLILVCRDSRVLQAINGMEPTVVQWESQGGMRQNFKVLAIQVPLFMAPYNGVAGIIDGSTP